MSEAANVRSVRALRDARGVLEHFDAECVGALAEIESDIRRQIEWLSTTRVAELQREIRAAEEAVVAARADYRRKELTSMSDHPTLVDERKAIDRAKARLEVLRERLAQTKQWVRTLEKEFAAYRAQVQPLVDALQRDIPRGQVRLIKMLGSLEAYTRLAVPDGTGESAPGPALGSDANAAPPPAPGTAAERLKLLRRGTPGAAARQAIELDDAALSGGSVTVEDPLAVLRRLGLDDEPVDERAKVVIAEGCLDEAVVYLERTAGAAPGDSGWYIGPGDGAANVAGFTAATVGRVGTLRPGIDVLMQLPPGWLVLLVGGEVEAVLSAENRVVLAAGAGSRGGEG